jgi:hypothetical protein
VLDHNLHQEARIVHWLDDRVEAKVWCGQVEVQVRCRKRDGDMIDVDGMLGGHMLFESIDEWYAAGDFGHVLVLPQLGGLGVLLVGRHEAVGEFQGAANHGEVGFDPMEFAEGDNPSNVQ